MNYNTIKLFAVAAVSMLTLHSCLDLAPQDQLGGDNMWTSTQDFKNFANNYYSWTPDFSTVYNDGSAHSDSRSDLFTYEKEKNVFSSGTNTVPQSDGNYTNAYNHIRRTNLFLANVNKVADQSTIKQYIGETYFFRAYSYFDLLQLYGDAIITDKPLDLESPELQVARNSRTEVADFIISDLNKAVENLPSYSALTSEEEGRVSKEAAQAFLSRVALYEGTWQKFHNKDTERAKKLLQISADAAKAVMDSKQFYLFGTEEDSKALGDSAQKYMFILEDQQSNPAGVKKSANHEYIWAHRHDQIIAPIGKNITKETVNNVQLITRNFVNLYLCSDGLPIEKSKLFKGYDKMNSEWQNRDNRMRYTLLEPGTYFWTNENAHSTWDWSKDIKPNGGAGTLYEGGNNGSGYANQKWGTERSVQSGSEGYDYPLIRYAEVLLNYAEAMYELNDKISDSDLDISLNLVRLRANPNMPKLSNALVDDNGLSMREEIRRERTVELYQEGFRIDDLKRWATAVEVMDKPLLGVKFKGTEFETHVYANGKNWQPVQSMDANGCLIMDADRHWSEKNYLYPLPSDQLQLNPNLKQNPGW